MDGGSISAPQFRFLDPHGIWAVGNAGVSPDIEVVDRPDLVVAGYDPSLEKAVEVRAGGTEGAPPAEVTVPPAPVIPCDENMPSVIARRRTRRGPMFTALAYGDESVRAPSVPRVF